MKALIAGLASFLQKVQFLLAKSVFDSFTRDLLYDLFAKAELHLLVVGKQQHTQATNICTELFLRLFLSKAEEKRLFSLSSWEIPDFRFREFVDILIGFNRLRAAKHLVVTSMVAIASFLSQNLLF